MFVDLYKFANKYRGAIEAAGRAARQAPRALEEASKKQVRSTGKPQWAEEIVRRLFPKPPPPGKVKKLWGKVKDVGSRVKDVGSRYKQIMTFGEASRLSREIKEERAERGVLHIRKLLGGRLSRSQQKRLSEINKKIKPIEEKIKSEGAKGIAAWAAHAIPAWVGLNVLAAPGAEE